MSQKRVITGSDDRGRPISRWEDSEPEAPPYGFMEPAFAGTIERRQATPDELAAARARETPEPVKPPVIVRRSTSWTDMRIGDADAAKAAQILTTESTRSWTPEDIAALRERTGAVTGEDTIRAMREAAEPPERTEEGPPMATEDTGQADPVSAEEVPSGPLWALSEAARDADAAWLSLRLAELTWDVSRAALAAAMADCATIMEPNPGSDSTPAAGPEPDVPERPNQSTTTHRVASVPATLTVSRRHQSHAGQEHEVEDRAQRVTEAVARHGGDRSAAAAELGMRPNAVAMVLKHADRRAGVPA